MRRDTSGDGVLVALSVLRVESSESDSPPPTHQQQLDHVEHLVFDELTWSILWGELRSLLALQDVCPHALFSLCGIAWELDWEQTNLERYKAQWKPYLAQQAAHVPVPLSPGDSADHHSGLYPKGHIVVRLCPYSVSCCTPDHEPGCGCVRDEKGGGMIQGLGRRRDKCRSKEKSEQNQHVRNLEKEQLKALQREITTKSSQRSCGIAPIPDRVEIPCVIRKDRAHWSGMQSCGSKLCVGCHIKARKKHIEEADLGLHAVEKAGGSLFMLTLTCSNQGVDLKVQAEALQKAYRSTFKRRALDRMLKAKDYVGAVRSMEIQINTAKGMYHPHMHVVLAFQSKLTDEELATLRSMIQAYWCESMKKMGRHALESQQHVTRAKNDSGSYVAKGAAQEIGNSMIKRGSQGSVSWVGLLYEIQEADARGEVEYRDAMVEMYKHLESSLHNKRLISISPDLRKLASVQDKDVDEQEDEVDDLVVLYVPLELYNKLRTMRVAHLVPSLLLLYPQLKARFFHLCEAQRLIVSLSNFEVDCASSNPR